MQSSVHQTETLPFFTLPVLMAIVSTVVTPPALKV